ncbi:MAG: PDZ domain-containing protein, partial [Pirellulaceae bacterium]
ELVRVHEELDIALLKLERQDLPPVVWHPENSASVGAWLATVSTAKTPVALGVVGVGPRSIPASRAVLGVSLGDAEEGAMVSMVIPGGGAYRAGIEEGDVISSIKGAYLRDKDALLQKIAELRAGQRVVVG